MQPMNKGRLWVPLRIIENYVLLKVRNGKASEIFSAGFKLHYGKDLGSG